MPEMGCQELVEAVTDHLEGALPEADRLRFEAHLAHCADCGAYVTQIRLTIEATARAGAETLSPELQDRLLQAFRGRRS